ALQDDVVRNLGRACRHRRRAVRAQAAVHLARSVRHPPIDRPAADGRDRRTRLGARRISRRDLPDQHAAGHRLVEGSFADGGRAGAWSARPRLRGGADRLRAVRTVGLVRPLAQGADLSADVSVLQARYVQAAEGLSEIGSVEMTEVLLSARDLSVRFGGVLAVNNVSFDVRHGEVFTLIGPNGAGKTTVFNLISRIYNPSTGTLTFEGRPLTVQPPHRIAALGIART